MGDVGENYRISDIDFSAQSLAYVDVAVCMEKACAIEIKFFVDEYLVTPDLGRIAYMATSGGQFSSSLGMGGYWSYSA